MAFNGLAVFSGRVPKTRRSRRKDRAALDIRLTDQDLVELDRAFPPPTRPRPLELL